MLKKVMKHSVKIVSLILLFGLCISTRQTDEDPQSISAFMQSNITTEANDAIEAYQTENSIEMEAYITNVHYIDER